MSRKRRPQPPMWQTAEDGTVEPLPTSYAKVAAPPTQVPRAARALDVCDEAGHLVAVVERPNRDGDHPMIWLRSDSVAPAMLLVGDRLVGTTTEVDSEGRPYVVPLAYVGRESYSVACPTCRRSVSLVAATLVAMINSCAPRRRPSTPPRLTLCWAS